MNDQMRHGAVRVREEFHLRLDYFQKKLGFRLCE